ncbi:MAG: hypothetical protein U9Q30_08165 [Campylobacterota bacterium]|nr:hypothetical protein [Campylobacterota bacterium]
MNYLLDVVEKIAINIKSEVFDNYHGFFKLNNSKETKKDILNYCNNMIEEELSELDTIKGFISKEDKELKIINNSGEYIISYVSIDNIDLLELAFSVGTIFGVYKDSISSNNLITSAYITYGPSFQLVYASKDTNEVEFYIFDEYKFRKEPPFHLNNKGKINSTGGDINTFPQYHKDLVSKLFNNGYRLRLSNSFTLDIHQIIFKRGGLYSNPSLDNELTILFELYPISLIIELLDGESIDGYNRILDIELNGDYNRKTPFYIGSKDEISLTREYINNKA